MRRFLRGLGWSMISLGAFTLYFLIYQLVGTNAVTDKAQKGLRSELTQQFAAAGGAQPGKNASRTEKAAANGKAFALMQISKIKFERAIVEGTDRDDLRKGPGRIVTTKLPGQPGAFAVSGHRTTYGAPFYNIDRLQKGDRIVVQTKVATYEYRVTRSKIVLPSDVSVLNDVRGPDGRLKPTIVLTTCNPRFSAAQRLIVFGELVRTRPAAGSVKT